MPKKHAGARPRLASIADIEAAFFDRPAEAVYLAATRPRSLRPDLLEAIRRSPTREPRLAAGSQQQRRLLSVGGPPGLVGSVEYEKLLDAWAGGDDLARWRLIAAGLARRLAQDGPTTLLTERGPHVLHHLDALWCRSHEAVTVEERNEARRQLQTIWTLPAEDGRQHRDARVSDEQVAGRYEAARAILKRRVRPIRNRANAERTLKEAFPQAREQDLRGLLRWWARQPGAELRSGLCQALARELQLEPSSIPSKVARGRQPMREARRERRRQAALWTCAWAGYDRLVAWCRSRDLSIPVSAPSEPRPAASFSR